MTPPMDSGDLERLEREVAELRAEIAELKSDDALADRLIRLRRRRGLR